MTQPPTPTTVPVQLACNIQTGPDGQPWICYEWAIGLSRHAMLLPRATAEQIPGLVADVTTQALAELPPTTGLLLPPGAGNVLIPARTGRPIRDNPQA